MTAVAPPRVPLPAGLDPRAPALAFVPPPPVPRRAGRTCGYPADVQLDLWRRLVAARHREHRAGRADARRRARLEGDALRNALAESYLPMAYKAAAAVARKYRGADPDDLFGDLSLFLVALIDRFDPWRGNQPSTLIYPSLFRFAVRPAERARLRVGREVASDPADWSGPLYSVPAPPEADPADHEFHAHRLTRVRAALGAINPGDAVCVRLVYGLDGAEPLNGRELGERLGVSKARAYQRQRRGVRALTAALAG